jgi:hypothetical protein
MPRPKLIVELTMLLLELIREILARPIIRILSSSPAYLEFLNNQSRHIFRKLGQNQQN